FASDLGRDAYDVVIAQDVLEHVEDPVLLASKLASAVRVGGTVLFANCFYPVIECHLPSTFHFRHTFRFVMRALGLSYVGSIRGAEHAKIFRRHGSIELKKARYAEMASMKLGNCATLVDQALSRFKRSA